jgi:hypothetical protein
MQSNCQRDVSAVVAMIGCASGPPVVSTVMVVVRARAPRGRSFSPTAP